MAQLRAGRRAGLLSDADADGLTSVWRFLWRLNASARLLTDRPLDMDEIGLGAQEFLLRETAQPDLPALKARLAEVTGQAATLIQAQLPDPPVDGAERTA
ncbi:MAG: hypothetical protein ACU0BE_07365, partial [Paracoccus sp. (in: a-proteobacteria)]